MAYSIDADDSSIYADSYEMHNLKHQLSDYAKEKLISHGDKEKKEDLIENYIEPKGSFSGVALSVNQSRWEYIYVIFSAVAYVLTNALSIPLLYGTVKQGFSMGPILWKFALMSGILLAFAFVERMRVHWKIHAIATPINLVNVLASGCFLAFWNMLILHFMNEGKIGQVVYASSMASIFCIIHLTFTMYFISKQNIETSSLLENCSELASDSFLASSRCYA